MSIEQMVGGDILRLITAGMYDNPLVLYREYIQNSADSISSGRNRSGRVSVEIDPIESRLTITDDGPGLSRAQAIRRLIPIGNSDKNPQVDRGLRGIGRLSALAFADDIHFTTRNKNSKKVTRVSWSGRALRDSNLVDCDADAAIEACTTVRTINEGDWPEEFFQVSVENVSRHAASSVLNRDMVREYISEVCPVPLSTAFPLREKVSHFLSSYTDNFFLDIRIEGDDAPIERPFDRALQLSDTYAAPYERLEKRVIPSLDSEKPAAVLWFAHTPYMGSIPSQLGVRGLRARSGNIQIGAEDVFSQLFKETRFNGWCVGEVHITDRRIVPNGRRDYFESSPHLRNLENHVGAVADEISSRCRRASSHRNKLRQAEVIVRQSRSAITIARAGYLLPEDSVSLLDRWQDQLLGVEETLRELQISWQSDLSESDLARLSHLLNAKCSLDSYEFEGLSKKEISVLQSAFADLVETLTPESSLRLIRSILSKVTGRGVELNR